jgi:putative component of membrane protein insertase Oxa1/YidC/SpoIIIJ protein YidD
MKFIIILFLLSAINILPQTDWHKWGKANYSYKIPLANEQQRNYSLKEENAGTFILKAFADVYWIFISDVDGDNCSFYPTCSSFFLQAVKKTNILQGTLMFADRFTRDMSLFKLNYYPRIKDGHFYDPVSLYTLNYKNIKVIPSESVVNTE